MAKDIFHNPAKSIPKNDSQVLRVDLAYNDMGARKGHVPVSTGGKSTNSIKHVGK
jgi:hypothetical protein